MESKEQDARLFLGTVWCRSERADAVVQHERLGFAVSVVQCLRLAVRHSEALDRDGQFQQAGGLEPTRSTEAGERPRDP